MISELFTRTMSSLILLVAFFGAYLHSILLFTFLLLTALLIILFFEWPKLIDRSSKSRFLFITFLYPIVPMFGLIILNVFYHEPKLLLFPLYPFIISWVYDSMGYFVGMSLGIHKICPTLSPGKSWEGLFGSFVGVSLVHLMILQRIPVAPFNKIADQFVWLLSYSLVVTITAFSGGMMISYLKRRNGLKDTGVLIPGHGGLLDRFDSIFFVGILVWIALLCGEFL